MELVRSRLGDDLHNAAGGLAVLGFETARLHLDFLHERQVNASGERAIDTRVDSDAAEAAVGDAHAIGNVVVFQSGTARDGRVRRASTAAGGHARGSIEEAGNAAAHRDGPVEVVRQVGGHRRGGGIYLNCAGGDFDHR